MPEVADSIWISRCRQGDPSAFDAVFTRYERPVYLLALQILGDHEDALDALQNTFVKAFSRLAGYDGRRKFAPWLFRIARNECIDAVRHRQRAANRLRSAQRQPASASDDPSLLAERTEARERVWRAVRRLSIEHREIIVLREFHGLRYREIAEVLDIPQGTVMSRLAAARKSLRALLGGMNHEL